jgi:hypothetical protein
MSTSSERVRKHRRKKAVEGNSVLYVMLTEQTHERIAYLQKYEESLTDCLTRIIDIAYELETKKT